MPGFDDLPTFIEDRKKKEEEAVAEAARAAAVPAAPAAPLVPDFATPGRADFAAALEANKARPLPQMQAAQLGPVAQMQPTTMQAATVGNVETAASRAQQQANIAQLEAQAAGTAPSAATIAAQRQGELNLAQQNALMASRGTGANVGAALANIQRTGETGAMNLAANLQANKIAEQQQAQQTLGSALASYRGQDVNTAVEQARLAQAAGERNILTGTQVGLANVGAINRAAELNAGYGQAAMGTNVGIAADRAAQEASQNLSAAAAMAGLTADQAKAVIDAVRSGRQLTLEEQKLAQTLKIATDQMAVDKYGIDQGVAQKDRASQSDFLGGILSGLAGIAGSFITKSDKNAKKNIKPDIKNEVDEFMESARGVSYDYKNPQDGEGKHISPLAQELAKSSIGKSMVIDTTAGKMVNYGAGFGAVLAALNQHHEDIKKLKGNK